jgi:hypothetical protein
LWVVFELFESFLEFVIMNLLNHLDLPVRVLCATEGNCVPVAAVESSGVVSFAVAASTGSVGAINSVRKSGWVASAALSLADSSFGDRTLSVVIKVSNPSVHVAESGDFSVKGVGIICC